METLSNEQLRIQVAPHGAELSSIVIAGKEYLWQADPAFWKRHSPVLFPIVGRVWEDEYRIGGQTFHLSQTRLRARHGLRPPFQDRRRDTLCADR
jgi:galactose mutarotase-like enzyme